MDEYPQNEYSSTNVAGSTIYHHHLPHHNHDSGWSSGWIIGIVIIIIIILLAIWYYLDRDKSETGVDSNVSTPIWMYAPTTTMPSDTFNADNYRIYSATSANTTVTIRSSNTNPTGQQFMIDNTSGPTSLNLTGVTFATSAGQTVPRGKVQYYVWRSTNVVSLISV